MNTVSLKNYYFGFSWGFWFYFQRLGNLWLT